MSTSNEPPRATELAEKLGVGRAVRHVFLCADQTKPKCAPFEQTTRVWAYLKRRIRELGLEGTLNASDSTPDAPCVLRTKADCLRVCTEGPVCVVYPDGIWYRGVDEHVLERILQEHVIGGRVVEEYLIARAPWSGAQGGG